MSSKRFKRKTCVYCGREGASSVGDHVLAREFALERHRAHLPIVPACRECNDFKGKLEHHLTAVMPFGGRHSNARENLNTLVPKRLRRNLALRNTIERTLIPKWIPEPSGLFVPTSAVFVDADKLHPWLIMVVQGLIWHYWQVVTGADFTCDVMLLTDQNAELFAPAFQARGKRVERTTIGGDALSYEAIGVSDHLPASVWRLSIYGGLELAGEDPRVRAREFFVTVEPVKANGSKRMRPVEKN